jgi:integrase
MTRRRETNTGLPHRVYERLGVRVWRFWYQPADSARVELYRCPAGAVSLHQARRGAIAKFAELMANSPDAMTEVVTFADLVHLYFRHQDELLETDEGKKASTTIKENRSEAKRLESVFGLMMPDEIQASDWYQYQDLRRKGGAGKKANKEIALASAILEFGRARGLCQLNMARGVRRVPTTPSTRLITLADIDRLLVVAATLGPAAEIVALAARCAFLCLRRPSEILQLHVSQLGPEGIQFVAGKRKAGETRREGLMRWSEQLRQTVARARAITRKVAITGFVFGNLQGHPYTKSGFGTNWKRLRDAARTLDPTLEPFTLKDARPGGVTAKKARGDLDVQDGTLHSDSRMIEKAYDRRRIKVSTPSA